MGPGQFALGVHDSEPPLRASCGFGYATGKISNNGDAVSLSNGVEAPTSSTRPCSQASLQRVLDMTAGCRQQRHARRMVSGRLFFVMSDLGTPFRANPCSPPEDTDTDVDTDTALYRATPRTRGLDIDITPVDACRGCCPSSCWTRATATTRLPSTSRSTTIGADVQSQRPLIVSNGLSSYPVTRDNGLILPTRGGPSDSSNLGDGLLRYPSDLRRTAHRRTFHVPVHRE